MPHVRCLGSEVERGIVVEHGIHGLFRIREPREEHHAGDVGVPAFGIGPASLHQLRIIAVQFILERLPVRLVDKHTGVVAPHGDVREDHQRLLRFIVVIALFSRHAGVAVIRCECHLEAGKPFRTLLAPVQAVHEVLPVLATEGRVVQMPGVDPDFGLGRDFVNAVGQRLRHLPVAPRGPRLARVTGAPAGVSRKDVVNIQRRQRLKKLLLPADHLLHGSRL